jgi:hypothetical protein
LAFGVHCYNERVLEKSESEEKKRQLKAILTYSFRRFYTKNENVYKDVIIEPIPYEVITLKFELKEFKSTSALADQSAFMSSLVDAFGSLQSMMLKENEFSKLLLPFPTFSKFMYMIQFSEHSFYYDTIYKEIDPALEFIMPRIKNIIQKFRPRHIPKEIKLYIAIVSYLPNFFGQIIANREFSEYGRRGYAEVNRVLDEVNSNVNVSNLRYYCDEDEDF